MKCLLNDVLQYAEFGYRVLPVEIKGKKPLVEWSREATTDRSTIEGWRDQWPNMNVAIVAEGLVVVDIDGAENPWLTEERQAQLNGAPCQRTQSGGRHYVFRAPEGKKISNSAGKLAEHVDIRTDGGYYVVAPSVGAKGTYEWLAPLVPREELPELPEALVEELEKACRPTSTLKDDGPIPRGRRNSTLFALAKKMRDQGMSAEEILPSIVEVNRTRCQPSLTEKEVREIVKSAARYEPRERREFTDLGNAQRFVDRFKDRARFCALWNRWLIFDGVSWNVDERKKVGQLAKRVVEGIREETNDSMDEKTLAAYKSWAKTSASAARIKAMLELAQSELPVHPDDLDKDPWLLNVQNGTLDLTTGKLREHRPEDMMTKVAPVTFNPEAECPMWDKFLSEIFQGDTDLIKYIQRVLGYALTGSVKEHKFFIAYGTGANGKGTLFGVMEKLMGDYGMSLRPQALMLDRTDKSDKDTGRLRGARLATCQETPEGHRFNAALVKTLTGGDRLVGKKLYADEFQFQPTHKLFLATNHKPRVSADDAGFWRRAVLIPFEVNIPEERQNKDLGMKLEGQLPGILNWILEGCVLWNQETLGASPAVAKATAAYRDEEDVIRTFIEERCTESEDGWVPVSELYEAYYDWCQGGKMWDVRMTKREFTGALKRKGYERKKRKTHGWIGLKLQGAAERLF